MIKLRITPDGRIRGLWEDSLDLHELGALRVRRASHVEYDNDRQCWCVRSATPKRRLDHWLHRLLGRPARQVLHQTTTRASALAWEHDHFGPDGRGWNSFPE
jgi:hypothetical protein